jgi:hypothetical protein
MFQVDCCWRVDDVTRMGSYFFEARERIISVKTVSSQARDADNCRGKRGSHPHHRIFIFESYACPLIVLAGPDPASQPGWPPVSR